MDVQKHLDKYFAELGLEHVHDTSYASGSKGGCYVKLWGI